MELSAGICKIFGFGEPVKLFLVVDDRAGLMAILYCYHKGIMHMKRYFRDQI